jgi:hypothetical protein
MKITLPYRGEARSLVREGDVLLFRGTGIASWFIRKAGEGAYSHVGLASWRGERLEIVEFREGNPFALLVGGNAGQGRAMPLSTQVEKFSNQIDVFRPSDTHEYPDYDDDYHKIRYITKVFDGKKITDAMRNMVGLPYGWKQIVGFAKYNLFGLRLFYNTSRKILDDDYPSQNFPVCSTSVAMLFRRHYVDLVPNRSDNSTEPSDLARSALLH